ncbi:ribonuclease E activity regulator RraA [Cognatishimia sp. WU-CL00825]|uniref:ribonuclease E activity regulator RraA n=1 Tax=Cognatishimia sp. WU-CL00825 TaxID=3127658 RepID=UPI0033653DD1
MKTADLIDDHADKLQLVHLPFRKFGTKEFVGGVIETVKCFEDNSTIRELLKSPGEGRILVVDGGASTRIAILGDRMAGWAIDNGWQGLIINGAIRDSVEVDEMDIAVFALGTSPVKSAKENWGKFGCEISFGGVIFESGQYVYADADGVLYSPVNLV